MARMATTVVKLTALLSVAAAMTAVAGVPANYYYEYPLDAARSDNSVADGSYNHYLSNLEGLSSSLRGATGDEGLSVTDTAGQIVKQFTNLFLPAVDGAEPQHDTRTFTEPEGTQRISGFSLKPASGKVWKTAFEKKLSEQTLINNIAGDVVKLFTRSVGWLSAELFLYQGRNLFNF